MADHPSMRGRMPGRPFLLAILAALGMVAAFFAACGTIAEPNVTPTPTRTPRPPTRTPTLIPSPTPLPSPTPTPAWPVTTSCRQQVPDGVCSLLRQAVDQDVQRLAWVEDPAKADVLLQAEVLPDGQLFATWVYALVAPFSTVEDDVSTRDLEMTWTTEAAGLFVQHPLIVSTDTLRSLPWGPPSGPVHVVEASDILTEAVEREAWAIVPFGALEPRWKVLRIDGVSPLDRELKVSAYPLRTRLYLAAPDRPDALSMLPGPFTNRDPQRMSVVMMTGVTALARGTAVAMEREGVTFPGRDIRDWMVEPDITHTSNEVSFTENCPPPQDTSNLVFCSDPKYLDLLEYAGVDVLELTGNHLLDWGVTAMQDSLRLFEDRGFPTYGGGWNLDQARQPLTVAHGVHIFGFVGCNSHGPEYAWATLEGPGAAPCDFDLLARQVRDLRAQDVIPIVSFQTTEYDQYAPTSGQVAAFHAMADAGAAIVSGSQAHWPKGFDFHAGAFLHYGLGNLFFDQMQRLEYRQEFLDRHVFYDGRHISTELLTAMLEDYARPRPMTAEERRALLDATFAVSTW